jgi:hypothetical protein
MILSIIKYSQDDRRIDIFGKFLGIGEDKFRREIFEIYMHLLKILPVSFYKVFEEENHQSITLENSLELLAVNFPQFKLNLEFFDKILNYCIVIRNEKEQDNLFVDMKKDLFFLSRFYNNHRNTIEMLIYRSRNSLQNEEKIFLIAELVMKSNKEYGVDLTQALFIIKRNFKVKGEMIQLDSFVDFFVTEFKFIIKITDFVQVGIDCFLIIFNDIYKILQKIWELADLKKNGIIFYKEFEYVINIIMENIDIKLKVQELFK